MATRKILVKRKRGGNGYDFVFDRIEPLNWVITIEKDQIKCKCLSRARKDRDTWYFPLRECYIMLYNNSNTFHAIDRPIWKQDLLDKLNCIKAIGNKNEYDLEFAVENGKIIEPIIYSSGFNFCDPRLENFIEVEDGDKRCNIQKLLVSCKAVNKFAFLIREGKDNESGTLYMPTTMQMFYMKNVDLEKHRFNMVPVLQDAKTHA